MCACYMSASLFAPSTSTPATWHPVRSPFHSELISCHVRSAVDAFIALGGNADKTGQVSTEKLRNIVKEFGLTIDINKLIAETDTDRSGFIDYQEFTVMMK
jgi:hypothetical protein